MWVPAICPWFALVHYKEETLSLLIQSSSVLSPKKLSFCQFLLVFRVQVLIQFNLFQENISTNDVQRIFLRCSLGHHSRSIDLPALESNYILYSNPTYPVAIQKVVIFYTRIQDILLQSRTVALTVTVLGSREVEGLGSVKLFLTMGARYGVSAIICSILLLRKCTMRKRVTTSISDFFGGKKQCRDRGWCLQCLKNEDCIRGQVVFSLFVLDLFRNSSLFRLESSRLSRWFSTWLSCVYFEVLL